MNEEDGRKAADDELASELAGELVEELGDDLNELAGRFSEFDEFSVK